MDPLNALSPIDGRYSESAEPLRALMSEAGLIRYRVVVETEYLIALSEAGIGVRTFTEDEKNFLRGLQDLDLEDAQIVSEIEKKGRGGIPATSHDVKAVEYFIKEKLKGTSLEDTAEYLHFALTSEDVNNLSYALMLSDALEKVLIPALRDIAVELDDLASAHKSLPMLARTHGQPASPTTFGKEFRVFEQRLESQLSYLLNTPILAKLNGATGNWNAHLVAFPKTDWQKWSREFIGRFNSNRLIKLEMNPVTTQIEPHDTYIMVFDALRRINMILIDFNQDMWRYISDGWIGQKPKEGEVGSSTMPHKVNPIHFENSEGNLGIANALFEFFARKLPVSRLQRDLSDSTTERNFGPAFAHTLVGYVYLKKGLGRIKVDEEKVREALSKHPEVLAEAIQTVLRREGVAMPYEKLKALTRGHEVTLEAIREFISALDIKPEVKENLMKLTPENYIGLAENLAQNHD